MKSKISLLLIMIAALWIPQAVSQDEDDYIKGFRVPEYDEDMNMKSQLFGDLAHFRDDGNVDIKNLKLEFFSEGEVETVVTSPECTYDRETKSAESISTVRIVREKLTVTGENFSWDSKAEVFRINKNARVVLKATKKRDLKTKGNK